MSFNPYIHKNYVRKDRASKESIKALATLEQAWALARLSLYGKHTSKAEYDMVQRFVDGGLVDKTGHLVQLTRRGLSELESFQARVPGSLWPEDVQRSLSSRT